jgi:hypothetical protein
MGREPTIPREASKACAPTEIFPTAPAISTLTAGPSEPRDANTLANRKFVDVSTYCDNATYDFMTWYDR